MTSTMPIAATADSIARAAELIRQGALIAFSTETVYGLGADATNDLAVASIFKAKRRPRFNPLIVHVASSEFAFQIGVFDDLSQKLCELFWPGALTLVVRRRKPSPLSELVSAGLDTVAIRQPSDRIARALIEQAEVPVAAPSANRSGRISPTTAQHVRDELGSSVAMILDGGPCKRGLESTVVQIGDGSPRLLRAGSILTEDIEAITGTLGREENTDAPASPGQLESHYAPYHQLRLDAHHVEDNEALLAFGPPLEGNAATIRNLSPTGDLTEAAANFFAFLRELDNVNSAGIAVMSIPEEGMGEAINDRLRRASTAHRRS